MPNTHEWKSPHLLKNGKLINRFKVKSYLTPNGFRRGTLLIKKTDVPAALRPNNPFRLQLPKVIKWVFLEDVCFVFFTMWKMTPPHQIMDAIKRIIPFLIERQCHPLTFQTQPCIIIYVSIIFLPYLYFWIIMTKEIIWQQKPVETSDSMSWFVKIRLTSWQHWAFLYRFYFYFFWNIVSTKECEGGSGWAAASLVSWLRHKRLRFAFLIV